MVRGPYWICSVLLLLLLLFSKLNRIFKGLNMLESQETLHAPQKWRKFTSDMGFKSGCGKMARQRHLYTFNGVHLELRFTYKYKVGTLM